jgi:hypothetical protein
MGPFRDRRALGCGVVTVAVLLTACGDGGGGTGNGASDEPADHVHMDDPSSRIEDVTLGPGFEDRCDLGFNTGDFNETTELVGTGEHAHVHGDVGRVSFSLDMWADIFVDENLGMTIPQVVEELGSKDLYRRHILGGVLTHTLDPDPWTPMTDTAQCDALAGELGEARAAAARYPTVADAEAAGYVQGDTYYAGLGVHYQNWSFEDPFSAGDPDQLLFAGTDPDSALVGLSYVVSSPGGQPPQGFTGDNDHWHRHRNFCLDMSNGRVNLASDVLSADECLAMGGSYIQNTDLWMLHVWVEPGCESDWGIFSSANPHLPYMPDGVRLTSGCNTGKTAADPLELDDRGAGPTVR